MVLRREAIMFMAESPIIFALIILQFNYINYLFGTVQLMLYIAFIATAVYAFYRLFHDGRTIPFFDKLKPLLLGFVLAWGFVFLSFIVNTDGGKKRVFTAGVNTSTGFINFQMFDDNTFKLLDADKAGGNIYRGNYSLVNDTLMLGNSELKYLYPSLKLVVKDAVGGGKYLEPVGGDILKSMLFIDPDSRITPLWDNFASRYPAQ